MLHAHTDKTDRLDIEDFCSGFISRNDLRRALIIWEFQHYLGVSTLFGSFNIIWEFQHYLGVSTASETWRINFIKELVNINSGHLHSLKKKYPV